MKEIIKNAIWNFTAIEAEDAEAFIETAINEEQVMESILDDNFEDDMGHTLMISSTGAGKSMHLNNGGFKNGLYRK